MSFCVFLHSLYTPFASKVFCVLKLLVSSFLAPSVLWQNNRPKDQKVAVLLLPRLFFPIFVCFFSSSAAMEFAARLLALIWRNLPFVEYTGEFCGLAAVTELHDVAILHLFRLGACYHHPMDLPDTTGLCRREGIFRCLGSVRAQVKTSPPSADLSSSPQSAAKSVYPQARNWASNSADLREKVLDPSITSVRSALKSKPCLPNPPPFTANLSPPAKCMASLQGNMANLPARSMASPAVIVHLRPVPDPRKCPRSPRIRHGHLSPRIYHGRPNSLLLRLSRTRTGAPAPLPIGCCTARDAPVGWGGLMSDLCTHVLCLYSSCAHIWSFLFPIHY